MELRGYQKELYAGAFDAWGGGIQNVGIQLATGGGKTALFSAVARDWRGPVLIDAHRAEIVSQISLTLARYGVRHWIIGPPELTRLCQQLHAEEVGRSFIDRRAHVAVASVDTLVRGARDYSAFLNSVSLHIQDEAHHVLRSNKWGQAAAKTPNAKGLYPSATFGRADGRGLGREADGLVDVLLYGPTPAELMEMGYLKRYIPFNVPSDVAVSEEWITPQGEYNLKKVADAIHESRSIVADVVGTYIQNAMGESGITFAVDVTEAHKLADEFRRRGVPAECITDKTNPGVRASIMRRFRERQVLQLVNVDILGEGTDVPAVSCVSFARHTASLNVHLQQAGRGLRPTPEFPYAKLFDHVGNLLRHRGPDYPHQWGLGRRTGGKRSAYEKEPCHACPFCTAPYDKKLVVCPFCHQPYPAPADRSAPHLVAGDLVMMDAAALAYLSGQVDAAPRFPHGASPEIVGALRRAHYEKEQEQARLREVMTAYASRLLWGGTGVREVQKSFFYDFGIDVLSAKLLSRAEAEKLRERIEAWNVKN